MGSAGTLLLLKRAEFPFLTSRRCRREAEAQGVSQKMGTMRATIWGPKGRMAQGVVKGDFDFLIGKCNSKLPSALFSIRKSLSLSILEIIQFFHISS